MKADEAAKVLGVEPARLRFLEMHCRDFLSASRLELPCSYGSGDLKILAAANVLHENGMPPSALKSHIVRMLTDPSGWNNGPNGAAECEPSAARLIAIASGKGGVGKSNIALNLAVELTRSGLSIALLDADLGVANVHLLAGLEAGSTLRDVVSGECGLEDIITHLPEGPDIILGSSGIHELANLSPPRRQTLLAQLEKLASRYDAVIVDVAAGVSGSVLDFVVASDFVVVVTTSETTAVTDAYALIKLSLGRNSHCRIGVVANRVRTAHEGASALERISGCARRFLDRSVLELGWVWEDSRVRRAVNERVPFLLGYPKSRASASVRKLAVRLREENIVSSRPQGDKAVLGFPARDRRLLRAGNTQ